MYSRWTALVGLAVVLAPLTASVADVQVSSLTDTEFLDWNGVLEKTTLDDRSILNEYIARTRSRGTPGAVLEVAFIPRFGCTPAVRIILPEQDTQPSAGQGLLLLSLDREPYDFPALIDGDSALHEYSFLAGQATQQELRLLLDTSSHLLIHQTFTADDQAGKSDPESDESIEFSLLGSRLSVLAVESHCRTHIPLPFELTESN